jgi:hypothetical protein
VATESPEVVRLQKRRQIHGVFKRRIDPRKESNMRLGEQNEEQREKALQTRVARRDQKQAEAAATVDALLADAGGKVPSYALAHAAKAREGKVGSLIALKCLDCCCWQRREVALCPVAACPLHPLRPYR